MIIQCKNCSRKFIVRDSDIPQQGRNVQCGYCSSTWFQNSIAVVKKIEPTTKNEESLSVDSIKASDGKTYKFVGTQWAVLLSSGKTGLFAKKKIGKELDKITGRKIEKTSDKKTKKKLDPSSQNIDKLDPSSQNIDKKERLPDNYEPGEGLGFFGYIFLLIIIGFSIVGILKTFQTDLINYFPEMDYIFEILDAQLVYVSETVKNIITIIDDLINSY